ncbi:MAG: Gfo/Idh/MocA family oxidoreductase [Gemmatimonadota bacterium]|nr:Gfo/Idh/MocA family oxidoreductase [Gemmatimonadota bacterium]
MTDRTTRREFLKTAAGAAAVAGSTTLLDGCAVAAGPAAAAGVPPTPPRVADAVNVAVIGTGGMGSGHMNAYLKFAKDGAEQVRVVGLCDVCQPRLDVAKARTDAQQGGSVDLYSDYRELLKRPDLHGVVIASPEHWHGPMAEDAIRAGKDVYVEKPMTLRLDAALRLKEVADANPNVRVQVGTQYVMYSSYIEASRMIAAGKIGKAVSSQTSYCRNSKDGEWLYYAIDPAWQPGVNLDWDRWCGPLGRADWDPAVYARWRRYRKYSTGIIGDLLVHRITPLIMGANLGWPTRVVASGGHYVDKVMENHDQVNINIEFENEHTMIVAGSTANEVGLETLIRGHKGNIYLGGRTLTVRPERLFAEEFDEETIDGPNEGDTQDMLRRNWLNSIRTREPVASPVELGTKVMVIVDLATRSMWDGAAYLFDPATKTVRKA